MGLYLSELKKNGADQTLSLDSPYIKHLTGTVQVRILSSFPMATACVLLCTPSLV